MMLFLTRCTKMLAIPKSGATNAERDDARWLVALCSSSALNSRKMLSEVSNNACNGRDSLLLLIYLLCRKR